MLLYFISFISRNTVQVYILNKQIYFDALGRFNRILVSRGFIWYSKQRLFYFNISTPRTLFCNKHKTLALFLNYSKLAEASKLYKHTV